jgi:tetratricopeptide (TPR) repeat protein
LVKGLVAREQKRYPASKESLYKLVELEDNFESNYELAETLFQEDREIVSSRIRFEKTRAMLHKRKDEELYYQISKRIGQCYKKEGNFKSSEEYLKDAIKVYRKKGEGYYEMGLTHHSNPKKSKTKKALNYFEEAIEKGYDSYTALSATARTHYKLKDYKKAQKTYEKIRFKYDKSFGIEELWLETRLYIALNELKKASSNLKTIVAKSNELSTTAKYKYLRGLISLKTARDKEKF